MKGVEGSSGGSEEIEWSEWNGLERVDGLLFVVCLLANCLLFVCCLLLIVIPKLMNKSYVRKN